ncbi:hypothetical protein KI387_020950, partial [Taxus chinensis]
NKSPPHNPVWMVILVVESPNFTHLCEALTIKEVGCVEKGDDVLAISTKSSSNGARNPPLAVEGSLR